MTRVVYEFPLTISINTELLLGDFGDLLKPMLSDNIIDSGTFVLEFDNPEGKGLTPEQNEKARKIIEGHIDVSEDFTVTVGKGIRQDEPRSEENS